MTNDTTQAAPQQQELLAEIQRLQRALAFWLPQVPSEDHSLHARAAHDSFLLAGYYGPSEPSANELGHVAFTTAPAPKAAPAPAAVAGFGLRTTPDSGECPWGGIYSARADAERDAGAMRSATGRDWEVVALAEIASPTLAPVSGAAHEWRVSPAYGGEICANCGAVKGTRRGNATCGEVAAPTTQAAPQPAAQQEPVALPFAIFDNEMDALRRFDECVRDGQGYDVPKAMMRRLSEIGLVRRITANVYEHTDFGCSVLNGDFNSATSDQPQHPAPVAQGDAEDAARYRRLRECNSGSLVVAQITGTGEEDWRVLTERDADEAIDAEINAARTQTKEGGV